MFLSGIFAFTREPIWEGTFQIVLDNNQEQISGPSGFLSRMSGQNPLLLGVAGVNVASNKLKTEVKILESPSVLKPVFDFAKYNKANSGKDVSKLRYFNWLNTNLTIDLLKDTSVLNISYRDTDKELILPVLDLISTEYQKYSGRDRIRGITKAVDYLELQLSKLKLQADQSMRKAQTYALKNSVVTAAATSSSAVIDQMDLMGSSSNPQSQQFSYVNNTSASLFGQLQRIDVLIEQKKSLLNSNDPKISFLERQRKALTEVIRRNLEVKASDSMLKYNELVRTALQDQITLTEMAAQLQVTKLEKARQSEPWQLISTPTLLDLPVAPKKKHILALGLFAGLVLGSGAALVMDRRTGLIWNFEELHRHLPYNLLTLLSANNKKLWDAPLNLLNQSILFDKSSIALLVVEQGSSKTAMEISQKLNDHAKRDLVYVAETPLAASRAEGQIVFVELGKIRNDQVIKFYQQLTLQGKPVLGLIITAKENDKAIV